jgi:hypothetical protein
LTTLLIGRLRAVIVLLAAIAVTACASQAARIRSNTDSSVDFAQYRSFAFVTPLGTDRASYESLVSRALKAAASRELEARGLVYDEAAPDLLVNFNGRLDEKLRVSPSMSVGFGYYGYRRGIYGTWPLYRETDIEQYTQGTLNVDVVDARRRQMVWEGVAIGRVTEKTRKNLEAALERVMPEIFATFPLAPRAAAPAP